MATDNGRYICCPLCNGKGQLHRSELSEILSDPQRDKKFQAYLRETHQYDDASQATEPAAGSTDFDREVHSWPPKRILWRRSPKE